ncbi:MAG: hypothetical protein H7Y27_08640 [Gemmatimonadaceae bacterium]|nr:hypothetical protein [Chitinophagaceae bacterium]
MKPSIFKLSAILIFFLTCISGYAQVQTKKVIIHTTLGAAFPALEKLNDELRSAGLEPGRTTYFSRGGGFYTIFPKLNIATLFNLSTYTATTESGNRSTAVRSTQVGTSLGYVVTGEKSFQFIPFVGLAYSFFGVRPTASNPAGGTGFSPYLSGNANQYHLSSNDWAGHVGLHFAKAGLGKTRMAQHAVLGLRTGYFIPVRSSVWKSNDTKLSGGPKINSGGFYVGVVLGIMQ